MHAKLERYPPVQSPGQQACLHAPLLLSQLITRSYTLCCLGSALMQGIVRMQASLSREAELGAETPGLGDLEPALAAGRETLSLLVSTGADPGHVV